MGRARAATLEMVSMANEPTTVLKIDGDLERARGSLQEIRTKAQALEAAGYAGVTAAETGHDPFLGLIVAADHTDHLEVGTTIAVAFARNPMTVAYSGYDMARLTQGRFFLGLGSQVKAHVERRYSMPWSRPAARMREFVLALHAIWDSWEHDAKLDFQGEFYRHTLMSPFFAGGENPHGRPRVFVAAVGPHMMEAVGEVADGLMVHGFNTEAYLRERSIPALERGRARSGRSSEGFELSAQMFVATGETEEEMAGAKRGVRGQIAFYGSTPAYRDVLDVHGWGDLQTELNALAKEGAWDRMGDLIDDEMLDAFAIVGEPGEIARKMTDRYGTLLHRISFNTPYPVSQAVLDGIVANLAALRATGSAQ